MELQHFSHEHPLMFIEQRSHERDKVYCSGCGELVTGPSFSCMECGFYLDKQCAEAPSEMNHPFHRNHSLNLLQRIPYKGRCWCDFCKQSCENFVYHCICGLDLHIKCALFSYDIGQKRIADFQHIARIDPLISTENHTENLKRAECFACWKPLLNSVYFSPDCGFYLHEKCVDLPAEINHLLHNQHPLILQFNSQSLSCKICQKFQRPGFVYCCSPCNFVIHIECAAIPTKINHPFHRKHPLILQFSEDSFLPCHICHKTNHIVYCCSVCKFALHIECASPPPVIKNKVHQHPFVLLWRHVSFNCDACGMPGKYVSYICSTCGLVVHKECISLPGTLKHPKHPKHPIFHTYFLGQYELETWECRICHLKEVNSEHGGYYCSNCNYIVHVNCAIDRYNWYELDESGTTDENLEENSALLPYSIIKETKDGENVVATEIKHFSHQQHNLVLSNDISDDKYCDGCVLPIFTSYYNCSQCDFCLHKSCAELRMKKYYSGHVHPIHSLTSDCIFRSQLCGYETNGFGYTCDKCKKRLCLRCASVSDVARCEGHQHPLPLYLNYKGLCNACGGSLNSPYRCNRCNFNLHVDCLVLPLIARHGYDEHPFKLTYHDNNTYPESHYCDICENERNPSHWFYQCTICNNSAHRKCVLGKYTFFKLGSIYTKGDHPHPLTFARKNHYYPDCLNCGKPCRDLVLECKIIGCSYVVHWECIKLRSLA